MPSNQKRLDRVFGHIQRIKAGDYPAVVGNVTEGIYRIVERPWQELPEPSKLAILQDAIDWSEITNKDMATILLSEIDPGRITDAQRTRLIDTALGRSSYEQVLREAASYGTCDRDKGMER